jgi:hypothetical protein
MGLCDFWLWPAILARDARKVFETHRGIEVGQVSLFG